MVRIPVAVKLVRIANVCGGGLNLLPPPKKHIGTAAVTKVDVVGGGCSAFDKIVHC